MTGKVKIVAVLTASFIIEADPRVEKAVEMAIEGAWVAGRTNVQQAVGMIGYAAGMYLKTVEGLTSLQGIPVVVTIETHREDAEADEMANAMLSAEVQIVGTEDGPRLVPITIGNA